MVAHVHAGDPTFDDRPLPERADVVIVGGGYTGTVAALQLARGGAAVTLLERHSLGWGASTRNGGIFHPGLKWNRAQLHKRYGPELGGRLFQDGVDAFFTAERFVTDEGFDCDYRRSGLAILAWSRGQLDGLEEELQELRDAGLRGRSYRGTEIHQEIGSDVYPGGIAIEESGMIHPGRYQSGIVSAGIAAGVDFHTGTPAERIEVTSGDRVVHTPRGVIRAGAVLIATNGYTDGLVPWIAQRVMPIGSYIIATEPMSEELAASMSPRGRCFFDAKNFLYYWHVNAERRLIFGGRASFRRTSVDQTAAILPGRPGHGPPAGGAPPDRARLGWQRRRSPSTACRTSVSATASTTPLATAAAGVTMGTVFGLRMAQILGRSTEVADRPLAFEQTPFPGAPVIPGAYRGGEPWFLPAAGEWLRFEDWWRRRGTPSVGGPS